MEAPKRSDWYAAYVAIQTESGRMGLITCMRCGAAILMDSAGWESRHNEWHAKLSTPRFR